MVINSSWEIFENITQLINNNNNVKIKKKENQLICKIKRTGRKPKINLDLKLMAIFKIENMKK